MYKNGSNEYYKMCSAFLMMLIKGNKQERYISSRKYEKIEKSGSIYIYKEWLFCKVVK